MDVQLQKLSVLEVTCKIRAGPALAWVPVIAVTSLELCDDNRRALKLGGAAYISKPFRQRDLLGAIRRYPGSYAYSESMGPRAFRFPTRSLPRGRREGWPVIVRRFKPLATSAGSKRSLKASP
jgi:DNA-binding response OmpR family regulator